MYHVKKEKEKKKNSPFPKAFKFKGTDNKSLVAQGLQTGKYQETVKPI